MGQDISNRSLAILLIISVVISLGGLVVFLAKGGEQITGAATSPTAIARINITSRASINWTVNLVDFGTGYVNDSVQSCLLNTEGANAVSNCTGFNTVTEGLRLINDGNRRVSVNLSSNVSAAQLLGGTSPLFQWKLANNKTDSCGNIGPGGNDCSINATALQYQGAYSDVSTAPVEICPCFNYASSKNLFNVELQLLVPKDSFYGLREATLTAVATVV